MGRLWLFAMLIASPLAGQSRAGDYRVGVVSESGDIVTWLRPEGERLVVERTVPVGIMPADIDGPHNLAVAPDQSAYYVTIAHGQPFGSLWKLDARSDTLLGRAPLELFPTTIALTPDGDLAFVANSDFHGDHPRTNVVSVIYTPTMLKITDLPACDMPHGVRVNHNGLTAYVSCMHSDELLVLDVGRVAIIRRIRTGAGHAATHPDHAAAGAPEGECAPTFVSVSPDDQRLYVACNKKNTLQVWSAADATLLAEVPVGAGAYNVEPTPDGRLILVTNKKDRSVSLVDAGSLREVARLTTTKPVVHGIAFSPDGRYAYISQESIGADPGAIDVVDLAARRIVSSVAVPSQPTGIAIWRPALPPTR